MAGLRSKAALLGAASVLLISCGQSGGGAASNTPAASSAPPVAASAPAPSDTASSAAVSALPLVAAAPAAPTPAAVKKPPTAAELLRDDPGYGARERKLDALYENAKDRDPTGQVEREQASALAQRRACADKACLDRWFSRREAALRTYVEN